MLSTICFPLYRTVTSAAQVAAVLLKALLLAAILFGVFTAVVCCWAAIVQLFIGGVLIAAFALATMPRKAVRK